MTSWSSWPRILSSVVARVLGDRHRARADDARTDARASSSASRIDLPGEIDSSNPAVWSLVDGVQRLFVLSSWGGVPVRSAGASIDSLQRGEPGRVYVASGPRRVDGGDRPGRRRHLVWLLPSRAPGGSVRPARSAAAAHRRDAIRRSTARRGKISASCSTRRRAARRATRGIASCLAASATSPRRSMPSGQDLYLYFSQYSRDGATQGVAVARLAWADRDQPAGKAAIWNDGAWLPASESPASGRRVGVSGGHAAGARRAAVSRSIRRPRRLLGRVDSLEHLSRAVRDAAQSRQGRSVRPGRDLRRRSRQRCGSARWSAPAKIMNGGSWYPQVIGTRPAPAPIAWPGSGRGSS